MSGGHRQQCTDPLAKPSRTVLGAHSVQLASKPPSAPALHWHLARDRILSILCPLCNPKRTLLPACSGQHHVFTVSVAQPLCVCDICAGAGSTAFSCSFRTTAQACATSPNLALDPLYPYMRQSELARTVHVRSSFWDSTTEQYIDLPYAACLWVSGRALPSHVPPCGSSCK